MKLTCALITFALTLLTIFCHLQEKVKCKQYENRFDAERPLSRLKRQPVYRDEPRTFSSSARRQVHVVRNENGEYIVVPVVPNLQSFYNTFRRNLTNYPQYQTPSVPVGSRQSANPLNPYANIQPNYENARVHSDLHSHSDVSTGNDPSTFKIVNNYAPYNAPDVSRNVGPMQNLAHNSDAKYFETVRLPDRKKVRTRVRPVIEESLADLRHKPNVHNANHDTSNVRPLKQINEDTHPNKPARHEQPMQTFSANANSYNDRSNYSENDNYKKILQNAYSSLEKSRNVATNEKLDTRQFENHLRPADGRASLNLANEYRNGGRESFLTTQSPLPTPFRNGQPFNNEDKIKTETQLTSRNLEYLEHNANELKNNLKQSDRNKKQSSIVEDAHKVEDYEDNLRNNRRFNVNKAQIINDENRDNENNRSKKPKEVPSDYDYDQDENSNSNGYIDKYNFNYPTVNSITSTITTTSTVQPSYLDHQPNYRRNMGRGRKRRRQRKKIRTSTTSTTTTTTPIPDYYDNYDDYDDYDYNVPVHTTSTTTTTTTMRPRRGYRRNQGPRPNRGRFRPYGRYNDDNGYPQENYSATTASTTSTSSTTTTQATTTKKLSPNYKPRPDGRIIDYNSDPNFPYELKGADLTNYPFYISIPDKINFNCNGRHDGYYASIEHSCQIYHHCAIGHRYDFLCPNYTLFDQTTFTCRFVNTVDCEKSEKHFNRNDELYVEKNETDSKNRS